MRMLKRLLRWLIKTALMLVVLFAIVIISQYLSHRYKPGSVLVLKLDGAVVERSSTNALGILSSVQMKDLISELKQRYDFVFFDSPPIMGVSDASILASEVDMTLQVIQYRRYPQPMNIRAKQLIEKVGGNLIGIVLNNINMSQDESYYYYSGYYHDYYSKNDDTEPALGANGTSGEKPRVDINKKY